MSAVVIGLDVGTSGCKAVAVRAESGAVLASAVRDYPMATPRPGWAEQDGADFDRAARAVLSELASRLGSDVSEVRSIGLTGQMHSAMLLDDAGALVRPAILWCDTRTSAQCRAIMDALGMDGLRATVRNLPLEGFTLPKLLWLREHEPAHFARVRHVVMPKDYVGYRLTGALGTEVSDASGTLAFDPSTRAWSARAIASVGLDPGLFPAVDESATVLGTLRGDIARDVGLAAGIPVARGAADNAAGAVGLGVVRGGRAMVSIGTSGVVLAHTDALRVDEALRLHSFCAAVPGGSYLMGVMLAAGLSLRWFRDVIARGRSYDDITALAARAPRGAGGVLFLPYLMGERTPHNDAHARGGFVGLAATTTEADLARAVLEGITFGLSDSLALMRALEPPLAFDELRATGGGARSAFWLQLLADVFAVPVVTTTSTEGPAFGAALIAGAASGVYSSVPAAADATVRVVSRAEPDARASAYYREAHAVFAGLYRDLRERFPALGRL